MADGSSGSPPSELGITPKDLGIKSDNLSARPQEFGRIDLQKTPYRTDVRALQTQYFPEGKYLKIPNGSEYILDANAMVERLSCLKSQQTKDLLLSTPH